ncbi:MAG: cohesin domain-containing protein [Patescibacteria group bacterium]
MSKRTLILIAILLAVTAVLLFIAFSPLKKPTVPKEGAPVELSYAQSVLTISSPVEGSDSTFSANVEISSGENKVNGVQIELSFDPTKITDVDIKPGTFLKEPIELFETINQQSGSVSYAIAASPGADNISGVGTVATITFRQIGTIGDSTSIDFEPKTSVTSLEIDKPILKSASSVIFQITNPSTPALQPSSQSVSPTITQ